MSSIIIFSGAFCHGEELARRLTQALGLDLIVDQTVISEANKRFQTSEKTFHWALSGETSVFNRFTHEKERSIVSLKLVLADMLRKDNLLFTGFAGHLIPKEITHVLRVGLIAETKYRIQVANDEKGLGERDAVKVIRKEDEKAISWVNYLLHKDPWDTALYDIIFPMDKKTVEDAVELILENVQKDVLKITPASKKAVEDFALTAEIEAALGREGTNVSVLAKEGHTVITAENGKKGLEALAD